MELSVIIPCYKVAPYLAECLDSALALPPDRVEVLCVDDASPDEAGRILAGYAARHTNLRVFTHQKNRGLSAARNTGLEHASGAYVLFLDGDDSLYAERVLPLVSRARSDALDILQMAYECFRDGAGDPLPTPPAPHATGVMSGDACLARLCAAGRFEPMTVLRLYRRNFLETHGLRMAEGLLFEDELFTAPAFLLAERALVTGVPAYRYRRRAGSIMDGFRASARWCADYLTVVRVLIGRCEAKRPTPGQRALRARAAAIGLSIPKNIVAYGLEGNARREAVSFTRAHRRELAALALRCGSPFLWIQGALLGVSLPVFLGLYRLLRR